MFKLLLAGNIGSGKSSVSRYLVQQGAHIIDLDTVAHNILQADNSVVSQLKRAFGDNITDATGVIDRDKLAKYAFACDETTRTLNSITHPAILKEMVHELNALSKSAHPPKVVVVELPLIDKIEQVKDQFDEVMLIHTDDAIRKERTLARGMREEDFEKRCAQQSDEQSVLHYVDHVIENNESECELHHRLDEWLKQKELKISNPT